MNRSEESTAGNGPLPETGMPPRIHLVDYLMIFARYRRSFIAIVVIGTALMAGYLIISRQTFSASATLLPPDKSEGVSLASLVQSSSKLDFKALSENSSAETFVRMLQSRTLADSLVRRFDLLKRFNMAASDREMAIDEVIGNFSIVSDRQGFIDISYSAKTGYMPSDDEQRDAAKLSADIVNSTVELLDKLNQQKAVSRARRSREFIGKMLTIKRGELDTAQRALQVFQEKNKALALDKQMEATVAGLRDLQALIEKTEVQLSLARGELSDETPQVQNLKRQLAELQTQKTRLESGQAGGEALGLSMRNIPDLTRQLVNLKLNLEVATQIFTYLEAQYNQEQIQEARELPTVSVMDRASVPVRRAAPRRTLLLIITAAMLMVIATIVIFLLDVYRRSWEGVDPAKRARLRGMFRRRREPTTVQAS